MNSVPTDGGFSPSAVVLPWMDKIVRHVSNPGTIRFPANAAAERYGFNHGFKVVRCLDFASTHSCGPTAVDPQPWTHSRQNKGWLCEPPLLYWCPHGHSLSVSNKRSRGIFPILSRHPSFYAGGMNQTLEKRRHAHSVFWHTLGLEGGYRSTEAQLLRAAMR